MQAQKLVRRIIELHREKPANRAVQDLRLLLKDQMDLLQIIIPRSAKIKTNFGKEPLPAFIEETGFRQVILNLAINARDAIGRAGKITISVRKVDKGSPLLSGPHNSTGIAGCTGAEICISDNGKGIPDSIKEKLFDPFFSTKEASKGSGLDYIILNYSSRIIKGNRVCFRRRERKLLFSIPPLFINEASQKKNLRKKRRATREFVKSRKLQEPDS